MLMIPLKIGFCFLYPFSCKFKCKSMMMNMYYSSNRNNRNDTNKLFYKVVIFFLQFYKMYIIVYREILPYTPVRF